MTMNHTGGDWTGKLRASACALTIIAVNTLPVAAGTLSVPTSNETAHVLVQLVEQDGASQRINLSGKLRMLSQRVTGASCYAQSGIDSEASSAVLNAAAAEFELITAALEFGNDDLGVFGAEERRKTQVGLGKLNELWAPMATLAGSVSAGTGTPDDVTAMADQAGPLLEMAQRMVTEITGEYSNPAEIIQANAMLIDIAGRQRMLAQRMSKNVCLIAAGINVEQAAEELRGASEIFDASLSALRGGMPSAGINPPPNDEIADGLAAVSAVWEEVQPIVTMTLNGQIPDAEQLAVMFHQSNALTGKMNETVGMYSAASKQGI